MSKKIKIGIFVVIILPIIIFILDILNISINNLTQNYDWLAFIGAYITSIITLFLAYITVKQNEQINEINKRITIDNIKANTYSEIKFNNEQNIEKITDKFVLKLNVTDKQHRPLNKILVENIRLLKYNGSKHYLNPFEDPVNILPEGQKSKEIVLEYTPDKENVEKDFYLARIEIDKKIEDTIGDNYLKLELDLEITNAFNLVEKGTYSLIFNKITESQDFIHLALGHNFSPNRQLFYRDN